MEARRQRAHAPSGRGPKSTGLIHVPLREHSVQQAVALAPGIVAMVSFAVYETFWSDWSVQPLSLGRLHLKASNETSRTAESWPWAAAVTRTRSADTVAGPLDCAGDGSGGGWGRHRRQPNGE